MPRACGARRLIPGTSQTQNGFYTFPTSSAPRMTSTTGEENWFVMYNLTLDFDIARVWEAGGFASKGLTEVAKWGSPRVLESELKVIMNWWKLFVIITIFKGRVSAYSDDHQGPWSLASERSGENLRNFPHRLQESLVISFLSPVFKFCKFPLPCCETLISVRNIFSLRMSDSNNCHLIIPLLPQRTKEGTLILKTKQHLLIIFLCSGTTWSQLSACWGPVRTGLWAPQPWRCAWQTAPGWITRWTGAFVLFYESMFYTQFL